ncbi:MAG TPA: transcription antitermination factor NusB [Ferruginibacter sp.]|nr:transcription antitermination factor NusB [Chitinophagales bacterium]HNF03010.1 transcription antitermination factor NusB [Ferruginibacter sp.]HNF44276.1 transcription antitermination factor NusB [Ferruginibacter sp.]HNH21430.1 transcription antitermination factor NusB [Ferruginibacter sp.]HNL66515.1 transcription antitermination factor NusB [Ferruginibacter sp.]
MISRRNIRVKVMQTLYSIDSMSSDLKPGEAVTILTKKIEQSRQLFTYLVYFITEVARYAETDARIRASKHLPTAGDLNINTKIAGNELLWKILEEASFKKAVADLNPQNILDAELLKKTYQQLVASPEYTEYIEVQARDKHSEKEILSFIFTNLMLPNEDFINHVEEQFINWDDDAEMMNQLVLNYLQKPASFNLSEILSADKWDFAKSLLQTVLEKQELCMEMIKPKLKNWDADRIAALDMILLQMGICEFLFFETIPTKVTINEYIDLAKEYSTVQSGQFVNGLLDNIHKELQAANKIQKKSFKNSTL